MEVEDACYFVISYCTPFQSVRYSCAKRRGEKKKTTTMTKKKKKTQKKNKEKRKKSTTNDTFIKQTRLNLQRKT